MQTSENSNLIDVLVIGTIVVVMLLVFLFLFVIVYQRRMIKNQGVVQQLQIEKQTELLKAVFETQESERKRLSEDLHDSVGQVLSAIKLNLHRLDKICTDQAAALPLLTDTRRLTDECIQEIRNIISNVLPPVLTDFGLTEALRQLAQKVEKATAIQVQFTSAEDAQRYRPETEVALYRIVQELFGNAIKHSGATQIKLSVSRQSGWLIVSFTDNGAGFNQAEVKHGFGLKNLQSRIQLINGQIDMQSRPKQGTQTVVKVNV